MKKGQLRLDVPLRDLQRECDESHLSMVFSLLMKCVGQFCWFELQVQYTQNEEGGFVKEHT